MVYSCFSLHSLILACQSSAHKAWSPFIHTVFLTQKLPREFIVAHVSPGDDLKGS